MMISSTTNEKIVTDSLKVISFLNQQNIDFAVIKQRAACASGCASVANISAWKI